MRLKCWTNVWEWGDKASPALCERGSRLYHLSSNQIPPTWTLNLFFFTSPPTQPYFFRWSPVFAALCSSNSIAIILTQICSGSSKSLPGSWEAELDPLMNERCFSPLGSEGWVRWCMLAGGSGVEDMGPGEYLLLLSGSSVICGWLTSH